MAECTTFYKNVKRIKRREWAARVINVFMPTCFVVFSTICKGKKSKYRHVVINKKKYYFYKISWVDITADGGHATADEFDKFECSKMVSFGYIYKKTKRFIWTFASYDSKDEAYSDRNVFPRGVITGMEKLNVESR